MPYRPTGDGSALKISTAALRFKFASIPTMFLIVAMFASSTLAVDYVWTGNATKGNGSSRWSRSFNWQGDVVPPPTDLSGLTGTDIIFSGTAKLDPTVDNDYYIHSLRFNSSAGAFTLYPQNTSVLLTLGSGGILNESTNAETLLVNLALASSQLWNAMSGDLNLGGDVTLTAGLLQLVGDHNFTFSGALSGAGSLMKSGAGTLFLSGTAPNTFSGGLIIDSGAVIVSTNDALGLGPLVITGGTLDMGGNSASLSSLNLQSGTITGAGGSLFTSNTITAQSGQIDVSLGGSVGLLKTGSGTLTLTAANTYTGNTDVRGGTLVVNNLNGSATGLGNIWIGSGGHLRGNGLVAGLVTNAPGGTISAGDLVGTLELGGTTWYGGAAIRWDLSDALGAAGTGWDLLNINGALNIRASSNDLAVIEIFSMGLNNLPDLAANFDPYQPNTWLIVHTTAGINFAPGESELTAFELLVGNFINPTSGGVFGVELSADRRDLYVTYTPIPEPSKAILLGLGLCGLIHVRRFKRNWR